MIDTAVAATTEHLPGGVLWVKFTGRGGMGSDGNDDGRRMRQLLSEALSAGPATGVIIDLTGFDYRFGNWIGSVPLDAVRRFTPKFGRVCLVATGPTAEALLPMWTVTKFDRVVPMFGDVDHALHHLTGQRHEPSSG
ncbi:MAG: hypothetical protein U0871_15095 [Gemmataceae bacterium]